MRFIHIRLLFILMTVNSSAQTSYTHVEIGGMNYLARIELNTCEVCIISEAFQPGVLQLIMLPDGSFVGIGSGDLIVFDEPPLAQVIFVSDPTQIGGDLLHAVTYDSVNDFIYVMSFDGLHIFDYNSFTFTFQGAWPANWSNFVPNGIFINNGQLYGTGSTTDINTIELFEIDITNPSNSTIVISLTNLGFPPSLLGSSPNGFYYTSSNTIGEFDLATSTWSQICPFAPVFVLDGIDIPTFPLPDYPCIPLCFTEAGTMPTNLITECVSEVAEMNNASGTSFQSDDLLQYILFTDENDTLNTTIATSNTPNFAFDPNTMTVNTIYYVTSIVGDNDGSGNVDLNDPCLDIGENAQRLRFVPEPSVTFSVANNDICENGCKEINALFTGVPPFTLTYQVGSAPEQVLVFNTTNGNFEICVGNETGSIDLQATDLSDGVCCD